ncbi:MAG: cytidylate kinase-like family protein [Oscillospiraceae bacterium]|jgi:cytidylate kinase|nr:cytidylate kinase-like family protein [Oscillospiraceae bacterium]
MKNTVITIARSFGSGGKEIGLKLAERLGIPCYEREILKMASDISGISESMYRDTDEKLRTSLTLKRLRGMFDPNSSAPSPESADFNSDDALFQFQAKVIRDLANSVSCVIVGKCADKVLANMKNTVRLYVWAPFDKRTESIMAKLHIGRDEAQRLINRTDRYRRDYYKYYSGGADWTDPENYDMILNSAAIGRDECVSLLETYVKDIFRSAERE